MAGLKDVYEDLDKEYNKEIRKPIYKKRGFVQLESPDTRVKRPKFSYNGICRKNEDGIAKVYPDFESITDYNCNTVRKVLKRALTNRKFKDYEWFFLKEI